MGTDYYMVNKEKKVAFFVGRTNFEDIPEMSAVDNLIDYMNNEENVKLDVVEYFWNRTLYPSYKGLFCGFLQEYGFELVSEESINLKDYIDIYYE